MEPFFEFFIALLIDFVIAKYLIAGYRWVWTGGIVVTLLNFDNSKLNPKTNPIHNGRLYAAFAYFASALWAYINYSSSLEELFGAILVGTLPLCIIAFFVGYILVKMKK